MRFELFKDRNFAAACLFMVMIGVSLFGTMALITPFTQNLLGYPILTAGFVLGSRGVGTLIAMMAVGRLLKFVEARTLVFCGLTLTAGHALPHGRLHHRHLDPDHRGHRHHPGRRPRPRVRAAQHGGVRHAARAAAHQRHRRC